MQSLYSTVHELFEEQVRRTPDQVALISETEEVTYSELNARANRIAHALLRRGVTDGQVVPLLMERSPDLVAAQFAVLKVGSSFLPLDTRNPVNRISRIISEVKSDLLLIERERLVPGALQESLNVTFMAVGSDEFWFPGCWPDRNLFRDVSENFLAYVIYTSGSTGQPKGVSVSHANMIYFIRALEQVGFYRSEPAVSSWTATPAFDASMHVWVSLFRGDAILAVNDSIRDEPDLFADALLRHNVSYLFLTASQWELHRNIILPRPQGSPVLKLILGGEAIPEKLWTDLTELMNEGSIEAVNMYGPTEATVAATYTVLKGKRPHIGKALPGAFTYVLDNRQQPVPVGVVGELYVGGAGVAQGYIGRQDLTADRFLPDPFIEDTSARMYRTGDRVRWTHSGVLEFIGRVDDQIKIRGFRIEPGEIEASLADLEGVAQVVVAAPEDRNGERHLTAYMVPEAGCKSLDLTAIKAALAEGLPDYMIPSVLIELPALPLNINGKVDKKSLPAPDYRSLVSGRDPRNQLESVLCSLFSKALGLERIGIDDDFFVLGGHSLLAIKLITSIRDKLNVVLRVSDLFGSPTVARISDLIDCVPSFSGHPPLVKTGCMVRPPLSFSQLRLLFLSRLRDFSTAYNLPIVSRLVGPLDTQVLRMAFSDVVSRHETLRTVFSFHEGYPYQKILPPGQARLEVEVVYAQGKTDKEILEKIDQLSGCVFDLSNDIPVRVFLLQTGRLEHVLVILLHHIAADGWSMVPLLGDLSTAFESRMNGESPGWQPLPVQYTDYVSWQRDILGDESDPMSRINRELNFWRRTLAGVPEVLELPTDRARVAVESDQSKAVGFHLDGATHRRLRALAAGQASTLFMVLHAAVAVTLSKVGAGDDVPLGTVVAGRSDSALDDLVGFFVNTIVLRTDLSGDPTFLELLDRVRETDLNAFDHQEVPFERVVQEVAPARSASQHPLFQVMFVLQNNTEASMELRGLRVEVQDYWDKGDKFDLTFSVREKEEGVLGELGFASELFDSSTAQSLVDYFKYVLIRMTENPNVRLSELGMWGKV